MNLVKWPFSQWLVSVCCIFITFLLSNYFSFQHGVICYVHRAQWCRVGVMLHCYLKAITVIPLLSTVFSVIPLNIMELLTFSCLTMCISIFELPLRLTELLKFEKHSAECGFHKVKDGCIGRWVCKKQCNKHPWKYVIV